jgi:hypothetical protein
LSSAHEALSSEKLALRSSVLAHTASAEASAPQPRASARRAAARAAARAALADADGGCGGASSQYAAAARQMSSQGTTCHAYSRPSSSGVLTRRGPTSGMTM